MKDNIIFGAKITGAVAAVAAAVRGAALIWPIGMIPLIGGVVAGAGIGSYMARCSEDGEVDEYRTAGCVHGMAASAVISAGIAVAAGTATPAVAAVAAVGVTSVALMNCDTVAKAADDAVKWCLGARQKKSQRAMHLREITKERAHMPISASDEKELTTEEEAAIQGHYIITITPPSPKASPDHRPPSPVPDPIFTGPNPIMPPPAYDPPATPRQSYA